MTSSTETKVHKSKQSIIDSFNYALSLIETNSEDVFLNGIVRRNFRKAKIFQCRPTTDIALQHQYKLILSGQSSAIHAYAAISNNEHTETTDAKIFAIYSERQCFGGAAVLKKTSDVLSHKILRRYNMSLQESGITEQALLVTNLVLSEIHSNQTANTLIDALIKEANSQGYTSMCMFGDSNTLRILQVAAQDKMAAHAEIHALECEFDDAYVLHIIVQTIH